jgi:hypothetical protein
MKVNIVVHRKVQAAASSVEEEIEFAMYPTYRIQNTWKARNI